MKFLVGQRVTWLKPKGGMLGIKRVSAVVTGHTRLRTAIELEIDGKRSVRYVDEENLIGEKECV